MIEVKDKLVTAESLKNAYDTLNNKSYEKLDVVYNKTNNSLVFQNTPELPDNVYVDKTLTESGNAADAKVTGDAITELKNETSGLKSDINQISDKMDNLPQPDWNQNDETHPSYVKNRPFYDSRSISEQFSAAQVAQNPLEIVQIEGIDYLLKASNKTYTKESLMQESFLVEGKETAPIFDENGKGAGIGYWVITFEDNVDFGDGIIIPTAGIWVFNPLIFEVEDYTLSICSGKLVPIPNKYISESYSVIQDGTLGEDAPLIEIDISNYKKVVAQIQIHGNGSGLESKLYLTFARIETETASGTVDIIDTSYSVPGGKTGLVSIAFFVYEEYENTGFALARVFTSESSSLFANVKLKVTKVLRTKVGNMQCKKKIRIARADGHELDFGAGTVISAYGIKRN